MASPMLPPIGPDLRQWGRQLSSFLQSNLSKLGFKSSTDNPSENGIILWDDVNGYPVVSKNSEWREIIISDGEGIFINANDITAAAIDTAYSITYDDPAHAHGVAKDATNPERIVFTEGGHYMIGFSAQIDSSTSSTVDFYFWPAINGVDIEGSTMKNSLKQSGSTLVVARTGLFTVGAGDYLEVKWAVSSTSGQLTAFPATAFCPSTPSTTLTITRVHA